MTLSFVCSRSRSSFRFSVRSLSFSRYRAAAAGASVSEAARRERSYVGVGDFLFETRDDLVEAAHEVLLLRTSLLQLLLVLV